MEDQTNKHNAGTKTFTCLVCAEEVQFSSEEEADQHILEFHEDNHLAGQDITTLFSTTNAAGLKQTLNPMIVPKIDPDEMDSSLEDLVKPGNSSIRITGVSTEVSAREEVPVSDVAVEAEVPTTVPNELEQMNLPLCPPGSEWVKEIEYVHGELKTRFFLRRRSNSSSSTVTPPLFSPPVAVPDFPRFYQQSGPRPQFQRVPDHDRNFPLSLSSIPSRPQSNASSVASLELNAYAHVSADFREHLNSVSAQGNEALGSPLEDSQDSFSTRSRRESANSENGGHGFFGGSVQEQFQPLNQQNVHEQEEEEQDVKPFSLGQLPAVVDRTEKRPAEYKFKCDLCVDVDNLFETSQDLKEHYHRDHYTLKYDNYEYCFECGKSYKTKKLYQKHEMKCGGLCVELPPSKRPRKK